MSTPLLAFLVALATAIIVNAAYATTRILTRRKRHAERTELRELIDAEERAWRKMVGAFRMPAPRCNGIIVPGGLDISRRVQYARCVLDDGHEPPCAYTLADIEGAGWAVAPF